MGETLLFDFLEEEFLRPWKSDANNSLIKASNDHSTALGVEPEFVALHIPGKSDLIVANPPDAHPGFFQFHRGFMVMRGIFDLSNIGPNVRR